MANINQKINIKEVVDVSDALKGIKQIQDSLSHLKVGAEAKASFDRLFSNIQQQAEKANAALATGFKNKGDVTKYNNAMSQIVSNYDEIIRRIEVLKSKKDISLDVDVKKLEKAKQDIKDFSTQLDQAQKAAGKFLKESSRTLQGDIGKDRKGQDKWEKVLQAYKDGKIGEATKALGVLKAAMTRAGKNGEDLSSEEWIKYAEDIKKIQIELDNYKAKLKDIDNAQQSLTTSLDTQTQIYDDATKALDNIGQAAIDDAKDVRDFAKATSESAQETQKLSSELEQFRNKAAYFFGISNAINLFKRALRSAYDTVKDLDAVMTETAVVTNFNVGDMWDQLPEYTRRANELGVSIHSAYEAATIFYQQGLKTNEVMAVSNETLKMARIAGLDAATASDRMTNALRGFNMEMDKASAQRVNDVYSKLAAITASDTDEISTAMTKVASLAHNANMEFETTAAFLAQIIESTRESAETAGTALKTVVARFSEVKELYSKGDLLGQDEEGEEINVNKVSTALRSAGINLNEYLTGAKGLDDIFIELAEKWDSLDIVQQRYIATMAAGSRQQSRFIALMSDYKRTVELVDAANNANGASQEQYGKTLESLETKLARLKNAWDEFILGLTNNDVIKGAVDLLTDLITAINKLISSISGKNSGVKMITTFFTAFTGFKIGQKMFGGTSLGKFFEGLTKTGEGASAKGAAAIAKTFYSNLSTKIADYKGKGGLLGTGEEIENKLSKEFAGIQNYFMPKISLETQTKIFEDIGVSNIPTDKLETFCSTLERGNLTIDELNQAIKQTGSDLVITEGNAADYGITWTNTDRKIGQGVTTMKAFSAAAIGAGAAMMALGNQLEQTDEWKEFGTVIKVLGTGLMAFGTIMSVYLPLQAQLMAKEVTGAIVSIPIVGIIAGIIAALTALGVFIADYSKNYSVEAKLENAAADAKAAADAANEAKEAYEKLGEAWNSLDDKYEAIENATKGTQEWRDAIKQVNDEVLNLLSTYEGLEVERDEQGILRITNQEEFDSNERNKVYTTEGAARAAKIREYEASQAVAYKSLGNEWQGYTAYKDVIDSYSDNLEELAAMTDEELEKVIKASYDKQGAYWTNPKLAVDTVRNYARDYRENQDAIKTQRTAFGATILGNAQIDEEMQKYANTLVNDKYIENLLEKSRKTYQGAETKDIKDKYAEARGYKDFKSLEAADSTVKDLSKEQMVDYLATRDALNQANDQLQIFTNNIRQLGESEQALFAGQEGEALTLQQAKDFDKYTDAQKADLYKQLGGDEVYGSYDLFEEWFDGAVDAALNNFDTSGFSSKFTSLLDDDLTGSLTSGTFKNFTDNLASIYTYSGEEGVTSIQKSIKDIATSAKMSSDELESFIKSINSVDWSSTESIATLDDLAREYGISEDAIKGFENQVIELNKAVSQVDLEKLTSSLSLAKKINTGEQGRSFTEEQYNEAIAAGANKKDFILNIETGNYDYIGEDVLEVRNAIISKADEIIAQLSDSYANAQYVGKALEGGSADRESADELRNFIGRYITAAGEDSIVDWDFFYSANLEQLQKVYDQLMQDYGQRYDTEAQLDEAKQKRYQTNSGVGNASLVLSGDEQAEDVLKQQLINSGLSEEVYQKLISEMNNNPSTSWDYVKATNNAGSLVDIFNEAKQYGIEAEDLNEYVEALRQVDDLQNANVTTLYELALANARYQEGFKNVIESYDEWIELKQEDGSIRPEDGNDIQEKAYTQLKKDLKEMFNLSEDVSDEFLQSAENVELLEKAVHGDTEAVSKLRAEMAKTKIGLTIDDEGLRNQAFDLIDDIVAEAGTLEFGATLDDAPAMMTLKNLLEAAGVTVTDMAKIFESFGWEPDIQTKQVPFHSVEQLKNSGYQQIVKPDGEVIDIPTEGIDEFVTGGMITVPVFGNATFTPPQIPDVSLPSPSSSDGGGGGSEKKPSYWENPYDELYNLQEKINEALRTREALERRYQKLLKEEKATLTDIRKAYYSQINNLRAEADLQKQFAAGRLRQIQNVGEQMYTDSEGDRSSFSSLGVTKYASYDANTGLIQIDWNGLEEIANDSDREEEGKAAEAYISKLEELVSSYEEVRDKLWEIEDEIENLREAAIESYLSFEDRVLEALVNSYQQQIDSYQAMSDAIEKASSEVLTSLREQVELSRQIRDNTDKEKQIADMENRLAYLQRDTSGANALEIQKLQKELEDARESYTDSLVDQAIEKMQNEADLAAEQRARQIETMQEQLEIMKDTGALWQQVYDLMDEAAAGNGALSPHSNLVELLKETEAFDSLSNIGQAKWWSEVAEQFHAAWVGRDEAEDKYQTDANNDGIIANSGTSAAISSVGAAADNVSPTSSSASSGPNHDEATEAGVAMNICGPNNGWGNGETRRNRLEEKGFDYGTVQSIVNDIVNSGWDDSYYRRKYGISDLSDYSYYAFKTGGLADFTGPAWLDGTKAKPELILNAQDSANFIALKDILASLLNVQGGGLNETKNGDNYFDIDISANIGSDYDVDRLAERLKQNIYNDGQYRNVNTINFLR